MVLKMLKKEVIELCRAIKKGNVEMIREFVMQCPDLINETDSDGTPLIFGCLFTDDTKTFLACVELGADINAVDRSRGSLLVNGIRQGSNKVVRQLLGMGVDLNHETIFGMTPLMSASFLGQLDIVNLLMELGAEVQEHRLGPGEHTALDLSRTTEISKAIRNWLNWRRKRNFFIFIYELNHTLHDVLGCKASCCDHMDAIHRVLNDSNMSRQISLYL
jgi:hypothetical protein